MATQYNFNNKYIECETWAQVLMLAGLAKEQGYKQFVQNKAYFDNGNTIFYVYHRYKQSKTPVGSAICHIGSTIGLGVKTIKYTDFIKSVSFEFSVGQSLSEEQMLIMAKQFSQFETPLIDMEFPVAGKPSAYNANIIEVTCCKGCPLYTRLEQHDYQYCSYLGREQSCQLFVDMFANCPVKEKSLTIKIRKP